MMAKGISNSTIIWALVFTRINVEFVSNERATRVDGVTIVERLNRNVIVCRPTCLLVRYFDLGARLSLDVERMGLSVGSGCCGWLNEEVGSFSYD